MACGLRCPVACGILVPWPGIKPASPTLHGGFLTTEPPGEPLIGLFWTMESFLNQHLRLKLDLRNSEKRASLTEENPGARSPPGCPHLRQLTDPPPPRNSTPVGQLTVSLSSKIYNNSSRQSHRRLSPLLGKEVLTQTGSSAPRAQRLAQPCCPSQLWRDPGVHAALQLQGGLACPGAHCKEQTFPGTCVSVGTSS